MVAQLAHVAQHRHPVVALGLGQHLQRRGDRLGIGVVAVVQDDAPIGQPHHPHPGAGGLIGRRAPDDLVVAQSQFFAYRYGDRRGIGHVGARCFFEESQVDSLTVAPYMGEDSVTPFLPYDGKWVILLALTSNKGSHDFQLTESREDGERLFEKVLRVSQQWADDQSIVVGEHSVGISLDKYMGSDYPLYKKFYTPQQRSTMQPQYIVPDCLTFYLLSNYQMKNFDTRAQLDRDLHMGKIMWAVNKAMATT